MEKKKKRELKKPIHQLKHFKVDRASSACNHKFFITIRIRFVGPKDLRTPAHFISSPRPMPRRKKCPRTNKGNPDC